jgi:hypothetical protein
MKSLGKPYFWENTGKPAQAMPPFTTLLPNGITWVTSEENPKVFDIKKSCFPSGLAYT